MGISIKKVNFINFIGLALLMIATYERLFNYTGISGNYTSIISVVLILLGIVIEAFKTKGKIKIDYLSLLCILPIVLYGFSKETMRYGVFFLIILIWRRNSFADLYGFHILNIIIGFCFIILQIIEKNPRPSGFIYSPTIFSCFIVTSLTYILFEKKHKKNKFTKLFLTIISLFLIYITESSSSLICCIGIIIYKVVINFIIKESKKMNEVKYKKLTKIIIMIIILVIIIIMLNLDKVLLIINRENREASSTTRLKYINIFFNEFLRNWKNFFIGCGGGYTQYYINSFLNVSNHMPLHQDILMILCEYGILGTIFIYKNFIKKLNLNFLIIVVSILATFHNLILCPSLCVYILISSNTLNKQYEKEQKIWS